MIFKSKATRFTVSLNFVYITAVTGIQEK